MKATGRFGHTPAVRGIHYPVLVPVLVAAAACISASSTPTVSSPPASPSPTAAAAQIKITTDCTHFAVRPSRVLIACGDGGFYLDRLHYEDWTSASALATGIAAVRRCVPDCAQGRYVRKRVQVTFDRVRLVFGSRVFTRAKIKYTATGRVDREFILPLGCSLTPPRCPQKRP